MAFKYFKALDEDNFQMYGILFQSACRLFSVCIPAPVGVFRHPWLPRVVQALKRCLFFLISRTVWVFKFAAFSSSLFLSLQFFLCLSSFYLCLSSYGSRRSSSTHRDKLGPEQGSVATPWIPSNRFEPLGSRFMRRLQFFLGGHSAAIEDDHNEKWKRHEALEKK